MLRNGGRDTSISVRNVYMVIEVAVKNYTQRECSLKKKHSLHAHSHSNVLIPLNQRANGMNLSVCMCVRAREHLYADQIGSILAWQRRQAKPFPLHVTATMFSYNFVLLYVCMPGH